MKICLLFIFSDSTDTLETLLQILSSKIVDDSSRNINITVRRHKIFFDACWRLRLLKESDMGYVIKVTFLDESAVDEGGPTREFFRL